MEVDVERNGIRGVMHTPAAMDVDALALTHGAGSNHHAPLLQNVARAFADAGFLVLRYDLPFRRHKAKGPPFPAAAARDREGVAQAVAILRALVPGRRVFAGGHSYGGRQTAMAAAESQGLVDGLLLLSYPLHPPNKPDQKRTSYFPDLRTPALFVHGDSDPFGTLDELRQAMTLIPSFTDLLPMERAGHDLNRSSGLAGRVVERFASLASRPEFK